MCVPFLSTESARVERLCCYRMACLETLRIQLTLTLRLADASSGLHAQVSVSVVPGCHIINSLFLVSLHLGSYSIIQLFSAVSCSTGNHQKRWKWDLLTVNYGSQPALFHRGKQVLIEPQLYANWLFSYLYFFYNQQSVLDMRSNNQMLLWNSNADVRGAESAFPNRVGPLCICL